MARFARIDSQIRANRLILANRFRVPELNPLLLRIALWGAKNCESQVWRANRFARIDSCESPQFALRIAGPSKNWDVLFWVFFVFVCFFIFSFFFFLVFYFSVFFWVLLFLFFVGFKGQGRWPKGPPHLVLNPPSLFFVLCVFCFFGEGLRVRWGGPKGHLT